MFGPNIPKLESCEPNLHMVRSEMLLAQLYASMIEKLEPKRTSPKMLRLEPLLLMHRTDNVLPSSNMS